jgi:Trypsin-co-occurring domain 1
VAIAVAPLRIGGVDVLVEVTTVAGSEPTSRMDAARERAVEGFERARQAIVAVATSTVDTVGDLARLAAAPEKVEVEFGLRFSVQGNVIIAGGGGEATLGIRLTYDLGTRGPFGGVDAGGASQ